MSTEPEKPNTPPKASTGFGHLVSAGKYSYGGFRQLFREAAFRQKILFYGLINIAFAIVDATSANYLISLILFLFLAAIEALNTGLENVVDRLSPEISDFAKHTKDLGSFAVFCVLVANGAFALYVVIHNTNPGLLAPL